MCVFAGLTASGRQRPDEKSYLQKCKETGVIIDPGGTFRTWWDLISIALICWIAIFLPFRLAFDMGNQFGFNLLDLLIDLFFITDVFLNTITAYVDDGHLVVSHKKIFQHYGKTCVRPRHTLT